MTILLQVAPAVVFGAMYFRRAWTLSQRGTPVAWWRQTAFALSLLLLGGGALMPYEDELFLVHMTQHVVIGDLAALAFVVGLTGPVLRPLLALEPVSRLRILGHPLVALPLWTSTSGTCRVSTRRRSTTARSTRSSTSASSPPA